MCSSDLYPITLPTDGPFLRRECPSCERQFKWHHGPTDERPDDEPHLSTYFCPYCGCEAEDSQWWTQKQLDYARSVVAAPVMNEIASELELDQRFRSASRKGAIKFSMTSSSPEVPAPLIEPDDMIIVQSPCHSWEPIKVADDWEAELHCLVCGGTFVVG